MLTKRDASLRICSRGELCAGDQSDDELTEAEDFVNVERQDRHRQSGDEKPAQDDDHDRQERCDDAARGCIRLLTRRRDRHVPRRTLRDPAPLVRASRAHCETSRSIVTTNRPERRSASTPSIVPSLTSPGESWPSL